MNSVRGAEHHIGVLKKLQKCTSLLVSAFLSVEASLLAWQAWHDAPTFDEPAHLAAGLAYWKTGQFGLYRVNPPLSRLIGSLPALLLSPSIPPIPTEPKAGSRPEFNFAEKFVKANGSRTILLVRISRLALIPLALLGGYVVYRWARKLYGSAAGLCALILWCASPDILAHGHLMTPDITSTTLGLLCCYCFSRWLPIPKVSNAIWTGVCTGLALLTKSTWILLIPIFVGLYFVCHFARQTKSPVGFRSSVSQLATICLLGICVLNTGYGLQGSFRELGSYEFISQALSGRTDNEPGNRFRGSIVAIIPMPFPANFIQGVDEQASSMDRGRSYLRGQWMNGGCWYFYSYAFLIKVPIGVWLLAWLAAVTILLRAGDHDYRAELAVVVPAAAIFLTASFEAGICCVRYVLPVLPALFIWSSQAVVSRSATIRRASVFACTWFVVSSLWIYPHSLAYFNELVGGPMWGQRHLLESNMDWGQDLFYFARLLESKELQASKPRLAYYGFIHPETLKMSFLYPPFLNRSAPRWPPGIYAVSVNYVQGKVNKPVTAARGRRVDVEPKMFSKFHDKAPIAMAGYTIRVYRITE